MSMSESQLREQYRNTSDEQLLFLAQQSSSDYTDTAWALLQQEMTRRGLSPTPVAGVSESHEEPHAAKPPVVLPLSRWGELPDAGIPEAAPPSTSQRHQTYRLGRLFGVMQVLVLFMNMNVFAEDFIRYIDIYQIAWSTVTGVAASGRAAWRWHTLVIALGINIGVRLFVLVDLAVVQELGFMDAVRILLQMIVDCLWFSYFYRRRVMFGARLRWSRLERYVPIVVGPDRDGSP